MDKIVDALGLSGELANTLLIFTSDNGFLNGQHRIPPDKGHIYEESIRVPLMMRGPGIPAGVEVGDLTINADLAPTIVDVANATPGLTMDGRSLIPVVRNPGIEQGRELLIESERWYHSRPSMRSVRGATSTPSTPRAKGSSMTFRATRSSSSAEIRRPRTHRSGPRLATRLHQLQNCAGSSCRTRP